MEIPFDVPIPTCDNPACRSEWMDEHTAKALSSLDDSPMLDIDRDIDHYNSALMDLNEIETWVQAQKERLVARFYAGLPLNSDPHKHVTLCLGGENVEIDEEIAPLIQAMWDVNIRTTACCQGDPDGDNSAFICFRSKDDASRLLLHMIATKMDIEIGVFETWETTKWRWVTWPEVTFSGDSKGVVGMNFGIRLDFPRSDIPRILKHLKMGLWPFQETDE